MQSSDCTWTPRGCGTSHKMVAIALLPHIRTDRVSPGTAKRRLYFNSSRYLRHSHLSRYSQGSYASTTAAQHNRPVFSAHAMTTSSSALPPLDRGVRHRPEFPHPLPHAHMKLQGLEFDSSLVSWRRIRHFPYGKRDDSCERDERVFTVYATIKRFRVRSSIVLPPAVYMTAQRWGSAMPSYRTPKNDSEENRRTKVAGVTHEDIVTSGNDTPERPS